MANRRKTDDVKRIIPLLEELDLRLTKLPGKTQIQVAAEVDMPNSQVSRILSIKTNPTWVDMTKLILGAGMRPDEAAQLIGFKMPPRPSSDGPLSDQEQQLVDLLRNPLLTDTARVELVKTLRATANSFAVLLLSPEREGQLEPVEMAR